MMNAIKIWWAGNWPKIATAAASGFGAGFTAVVYAGVPVTKALLLAAITSGLFRAIGAVASAVLPKKEVLAASASRVSLSLRRG